MTLYEEVCILKSGIVGTIIDSYSSRGKTFYVVESETPDGFELFDCLPEELSRKS